VDERIGDLSPTNLVLCRKNWRWRALSVPIGFTSHNPQVSPSLSLKVKDQYLESHPSSA
jgi:hypothetical protein